MEFHPLDRSPAAMRLLDLACRGVAERAHRRLRSIKAGDGNLVVSDLGVTIGIDIASNGYACFVANRWNSDGTREVVSTGILSPPTERA